MVRGNRLLVFIQGEKKLCVVMEASVESSFLCLAAARQGTKRVSPLVLGYLLDALFTRVKYFYAAVFLLVDSVQKGIAWLISFASFSRAFVATMDSEMVFCCLFYVQGIFGPRNNVGGRFLFSSLDSKFQNHASLAFYTSYHDDWSVCQLQSVELMYSTLKKNKSCSNLGK
jgi:hypothetical protein